MGSFLSVSISCDTAISSFQKCFCRKASYIYELRENLKTLKVELQKLNEAKIDVETRVMNAERDPQMKRAQVVQGWLTRVEAVTAEIDELTNNSPKQIQKLCFDGFCSKDFMSSYKFGKAITKKRQVVASLMDEGLFDVVAERAPAAVVTERPIDPTSIGTLSTLNEVWRCLTEEQDGIIGICGMGGVGKTTLLVQINNRFRYTLNDFDVIIWVTVSKDLQLEKIQKDIGERLGLLIDLWDSKGVEEKASKIFHILKNKKFVLLLDDIWERVDLKTLGVPLPSSNIASKVIFTTRSLEVCGYMEAQKTLKVECLKEDEAWDLFQEKVGRETLESHPDVPRLAKIVCKECKGLPIALITIGRAMAFKETLEEWNGIIQLLKRSAYEFSGTSEMYPLLKLSYDCLPNDKTRSCFLYCALFPEDSSINKEKLINFWISEGFLDMYELSEARYQGYLIIGALLRACLLGKAGNNCVKMHDVIRDLGLWIANKIEKEKENFLVHSGVGLTEAPMIGNGEKFKRVSLMRNRIMNLSETPSCPELLTLFLNYNNLERISGGFFEFMPRIKVFDLSANDSLIELPLTMSKLTSLHHLDLSFTGIIVLPLEFKALVNLKYLDLRGLSKLCMIPFGLLSSFSKLRTFKILGYSKVVNEEENNVLYGGSELLVTEILCLEYLNELSIELRSCRAVRRLSSWHKSKGCVRALRVEGSKDFKSFKLSSVIEMEHLEWLRISSIEFLQVQKLSEFQGFVDLRTVFLHSCSKLKDLTWLAFLPNLEAIIIEGCHNIEEILSDEIFAEVPGTDPFEKLKFFSLSDMKRLGSIYPGLISAPLLEQVRIYNCPELRELPFYVNTANGNTVSLYGEKHWWDELQWNDKATRHAFVPIFGPER